MSNKVQSSNEQAMGWADNLSSSGKWQAWLAMEEHDAHCKSKIVILAGLIQLSETPLQASALE